MFLDLSGLSCHRCSAQLTKKPQTNSQSGNLRREEKNDRPEVNEYDPGKGTSQDLSINLELEKDSMEGKTSFLKMSNLPRPHHPKSKVQQSTRSAIPLCDEQILKGETIPNPVQKQDPVSPSPSSSSSASSIISISGGPAIGSLKSSSDPLMNYGSRRSSTMTNKYSLLDALDLEYALLKVAARNSLGAYSLSQSLQKLSFTQSLAFPALTRGHSSKRNSSQSNSRSPLNPLKPGVTAFAKVITVLILVLISILVFGAMYKFIGT